MSRFKAAGIHLGISLIVAMLVGCLIYFVWYPEPYFEVAGGSKLMLLIMGVDVVLGPLLTLILFRAGKRGLRFDLSVVALLQLCAFFYGFWVIANSRPVFIVAVIDRFIPVYANDLADTDLAQAKSPTFSTRSWLGPQLIGAVLPSDTTEKNELVFSGVAGKDIEKFPKYYVPYSQVAEAMSAKAKPLSDLESKSAMDKNMINQYLTSHSRLIDQVAYLPLHGRTAEYSMLLSKDTGLPLDALAINPW